MAEIAQLNDRPIPTHNLISGHKMDLDDKYGVETSPDALRIIVGRPLRGFVGAFLCVWRFFCLNVGLSIQQNTKLIVT